MGSYIAFCNIYLTKQKYCFITVYFQVLHENKENSKEIVAIRGAIQIDDDT